MVGIKRAAPAVMNYLLSHPYLFQEMYIMNSIDGAISELLHEGQ